ncbi:MAG: transcription antitermination factor NusB [Lentisphaeria bacterium]
MTQAPTNDNGKQNYQKWRRRAREWALQVLYQLDVADETLETETLENFWQRALEREVESEEDDNDRAGKKARAFAERLIRGVLQERSDIDAKIMADASNWRLERMGVVDRNILRLSTYEILFSDETPILSALNEGIELAKQFGDKDSPRFINGILDKLKENAQEMRKDQK